MVWSEKMAGKRWRKQWDLTEESVQIFYLILLLNANGRTREN